MRVNILITCEEHLHDHIISLRVEVWANKTTLTLALFIEVPVQSQENERSCICVIGIDFTSFYDFDIGVWNCSNNVVFLAELRRTLLII